VWWQRNYSAAMRRSQVVESYGGSEYASGSDVKPQVLCRSLYTTFLK
jgi:hypothetical protein